LPEGRQVEIVEYLDGDGAKGKPHTTTEGVAWLEKKGISTSASTLSRFRSWRRLREELEEHAQTAKQITEELRKQGAIKTAEEEFAAGAVFFGRLALQRRDNPGFVRILRERSREKIIRLMERRVALLERREKKIKAAVSDGKMTADEKEARVKEILGIH
jgi:hypothetical protein